MRDESKTKTILASALIILAIVTLLTISLTYARYSEEITSSDDRHTGDTEYIVAHQLEVRSVEEFIAAVENGYSNIRSPTKSKILLSSRRESRTSARILYSTSTAMRSSVTTASPCLT